MNIFSKLFPKKENKAVEPSPEITPAEETYSIDKELQKLIDEYGFATFPEAMDGSKPGIPYKYLRNKEDFHELWSQDIMAYMISMPGAQGTPGMIVIATHQNLFYAGNYCYSGLTYSDFRPALPSLTENLEDLEPWNRPEENIDGWYWYGIHSGCWLRVHESIWERFYHNARFFDHVAWIRDTWSTFVMEANAARRYDLEKTMSALSTYDAALDFSLEDAERIEEYGIIAWKESDQGFAGLLCKDGKSYFRCADSGYRPSIPFDQREDIRNDMLKGWRCYYCGLGHRVMIREDYDKSFREKTYGLGKNGELWNNAFGVLCTILKERN